MANTLANYVKFLRGTPTAYAALAEKDKDTLYFITAEGQKLGKIYLGEVLVAGNVTAEGDSIIDSLAELIDVDLRGLTNGQVLGYNGTKWVPMDLPKAVAVSVMTGATANTAGAEGLVPMPKAGDEYKFLRGDGTWATVEISTSDNYIKSTDNNFNVDETGMLILKDISIGKVVNLEEILNAKINKQYFPVVDETTGETINVEGTLLSPKDKNKLDALIIGDNGVEISGKVNASNVEGLDEWIVTNRNTISGLLSQTDKAKLDVLVDLIHSVNNEFVITEDKQLQLASIPMSKVENLSETLDQYLLKKNYDENMATLNSDIIALKQASTWSELI